MIKGLDDDEIEFLDLVDRTKLAADRKKSLEEERELIDYRNRVATLHEKAMENKLQAELTVNKTKNVSANRQSQQKLLKGVVIKKSEQKKRKHEDDEAESSVKKFESGDAQNGDKPKEVTTVLADNKTGDKEVAVNGLKTTNDHNVALTCIGILPGIGFYTESSSECSSDSECEQCPKPQVDILGRKIVKKSKEDET